MYLYSRMNQDYSFIHLILFALLIFSDILNDFFPEVASVKFIKKKKKKITALFFFYDLNTHF